MIKAIKKAAAFVFAAVTVFSVQISAISAQAASWPVDSAYTQISTYFNELRNVYNVSGYHNGADIPAPEGSNIYAAAAGTVISACWMDAYGYMVVLWHEDYGVYSFYAHCSSMAVSAGQSVSEGQVIAYVGNTGESYGAHLHFGVCDTLLNGWPTTTYYDPLTYFSYDGSGGNVTDPVVSPETTEWGSTDYAGIYTTKNVNTYLNIRKSSNTDSAVIGKITPGAEFKVIRADGSWAMVEYDGITGYSSMDYMERVGDVAAAMSIEGETKPEGNLPPGQPFILRGVITSELPIAKVWGGVYTRTGEPTAQYYEDEAGGCTYDLNRVFDSKIVFNALDTGYYSYIVMASDSEGNTFELICSDFTIGAPEYDLIGDVNGDGRISVSDAVMLQNYLIGSCEFSEAAYRCSDINSDSKVNVFDMLYLQDMIPSTSN